VEDIEKLLPHLPEENPFSHDLDEADREKLIEAMPHLKARAKLLPDLIDGARFLFVRRPLDIDEKAAKLLDSDGRARLQALLPQLEAAEAWTAESVEAAIRSFAEEEGAKLGQIAQPLRASLTGRTTSPGIFDVLVLLGRDETLARIKDQTATPQ
jgi:glutamyl-tRNA synthetase